MKVEKIIVYLIYLNDNVKYLHIYNYNNNNSIAEIENSPYTQINILKESGSFDITWLLVSLFKVIFIWKRDYIQ